VSEQPQECTVGDVTGRAEVYTEERKMEVRTSSQPPEWKDKQLVVRSPRRKAVTMIVLPCIPEGVHVAANLLGHVEKILTRITM
jgi:hypothetical protein